MGLAFEIAILLALTLLNGFFAMSEMSVVSSRRIRLQNLADQGDKGAAVAVKLSDDPGRFLSVVQVGITLIGVLSGAVGGATLGARLGEFLDTVPGIAPRGGEVAFIVVVIAITMLSIIVGELVPKRIALATPEKIASRVARPLMAVALVGRPAVWFLEASTALLLRLIGVRQTSSGSVTEEEVKIAIAEGAEAGVIDAEEERMIEGVLALADHAVTSVMTPRPDVFWVDLDDPAETVVAEIASCPYSRIVVVRGGDIGAPVGVVQQKDLFTDLASGRPCGVASRVIVPLVVPESLSVMQMLERFRTVTVHVAFVIDEYGDFLGLVTLTDVLRAIAGFLPEEHNEGSSTVLKRADGSWLVDGRAPIGEVEDVLELDVGDTTEFHTAAGLALEQLARIPAEGDSFELKGWKVEVVDMDGNRIDKLLFTPPEMAGNA